MRMGLDTSGHHSADDFEIDDGDADDASSRASQQFAVDSKLAAARQEREELAANETRAVRILRVAAFGMLFITGCIVSVGIYYVVQRSQEESFRTENDAGATKIIESFHTSIRQTLESFDALSTAVTIMALETGATFPNVTIPSFETLAASTRIASRSMYLQYTPLIQDDDRLGWEAYSRVNYGHLMPAFQQESMHRAEQDERFGYEAAAPSPGMAPQVGAPPSVMQEESSFQGPPPSVVMSSGSPQQSPSMGVITGDAGGYGGNMTSPTYNEQIFGVDFQPKAPGTGPYYPIWQMSPVLPIMNILNFNQGDVPVFGEPYGVVINTSMATFGTMTNAGDSSGAESAGVVGFLNAALNLGQFRHFVDTYSNSPVVNFAYPLFDSIQPNARQVVGILGSTIYLRLLFQNSLTSDGDSYVVVVRNTAGQEESYLIDGPNVKYLGGGDFHDMKFHDMESNVKVADYVQSIVGPESTSYTTAALDSSSISYSIHIYPTQEMEARYLTNDPYAYAVVVASIFVFAASVFVFYNILVERRQRLVMDRAAKSSAVVKSLFPANVEQRIYEGAEEKGHHASFANNKASQRQSTAIQRMHRTLNSHFGPNEETNVLSIDHSPPIADLFSACTVYFADLAGFTAWSSGRDPIEVFGLLETLYQAFDKLGRRHGVFKVETIGDCYVAVTGLPQPQDDHAIRMAKFAVACQSKLKELLIPLTEKFGNDTSKLALRCGLNSGPVTAGVLRGERGRFQLFGDTVNVAARMESHGIPGNIHLSQSTADELIAAGKAPWVVPRKDPIHAKGKGELSTFFLMIRPPGTSFSSNSSSRKRKCGQKNADDTIPPNDIAGSTTGCTDADGSASSSSSSINCEKATDGTTAAASSDDHTSLTVSISTP